jgi:hypothetical protein
MILRLLLPTFLLAVAPMQTGFAGTWISEVSLRVGVDSAGVPRTQMAQARMVLTQVGDSLHGTWQIQPAEGRPAPPPTQLSGVVSQGRAHLTAQVSTATVNGPNGEMRVSMQNSYDLEIRGDSLVGTQQAAAMDGSIRSNPRPFAAVRARP